MSKSNKDLVDNLSDILMEAHSTLSRSINEYSFSDKAIDDLTSVDLLIITAMKLEHDARLEGENNLEETPKLDGKSLAEHLINVIEENNEALSKSVTDSYMYKVLSSNQNLLIKELRRRLDI